MSARSHVCRGKRVVSKTGREEALLKDGACGDENAAHYEPYCCRADVL